MMRTTPNAKKTTKTRRRIAPRLLDGATRDSINHGLPEVIKQGLKGIAQDEGQSVSWVLEQALTDYFGLKRPKYRIPQTWKAPTIGQKGKRTR